MSWPGAAGVQLFSTGHFSLPEGPSYGWSVAASLIRRRKRQGACVRAQSNLQAIRGLPGANRQGSSTPPCWRTTALTSGLVGGGDAPRGSNGGGTGGPLSLVDRPQERQPPRHTKPRPNVNTTIVWLNDYRGIHEADRQHRLRSADSRIGYGLSRPHVRKRGETLRGPP